MNAQNYGKEHMTAYGPSVFSTILQYKLLDLEQKLKQNVDIDCTSYTLRCKHRRKAVIQSPFKNFMHEIRLGYGLSLISFIVDKR
jgi:hypothetical protein